jgi:hypothetical protein
MKRNITLRGWLRAAAAGAAAIAAAPAVAAPSGTPLPPPIVLRVAAQQGTEPKFLDGSNGAIAGICPDVMRGIERIDPGLKFSGDQHWMPLTRVVSEMAAGQQDAACALHHTREREEKFRFLHPALYSVDYVLLARKDDPIVVNSWEDLRRIRPAPVVLVNRGFAVNTTLDGVPGIQIDASANDTKLNLDKLLAGRGRLYFHRGPGLQHLLERAGVSDRIRILPQSMLRTEAYFVVGRHVPAQTAERVRRALLQLERSGELNAIYRKWN